MVNTITLSSDMKTLYLIDDERAIPFDLTNGNGVLIGTFLGQVTVATAVVDTKDSSGGKGSNPKDRVIKLKGNQWTMMYNPELELLHNVGEVDIDFYISRGEEPKTESYTIDLKKNIVKMRRVGDVLELEIITPSSKTA